MLVTSAENRWVSQNLHFSFADTSQGGMVMSMKHVPLTYQVIVQGAGPGKILIEATMSISTYSTVSDSRGSF